MRVSASACAWGKSKQIEKFHEKCTLDKCSSDSAYFSIFLSVSMCVLIHNYVATIFLILSIPKFSHVRWFKRKLKIEKKKRLKLRKNSLIHSKKSGARLQTSCVIVQRFFVNRPVLDRPTFAFPFVLSGLLFFQHRFGVYVRIPHIDTSISNQINFTLENCCPFHFVRSFLQLKNIRGIHVWWIWAL